MIHQLLDEVEHNFENYQGRGPCYLPKTKAEADNTNQSLDNFAIMRKPNPIIVLLDIVKRAQHNSKHTKNFLMVTQENPLGETFVNNFNDNDTLS